MAWLLFTSLNLPPCTWGTTFESGNMQSDIAHSQCCLYAMGPILLITTSVGLLLTIPRIETPGRSEMGSGISDMHNTQHSDIRQLRDSGTLPFHALGKEFVWLVKRRATRTVDSHGFIREGSRFGCFSVGRNTMASTFQGCLYYLQ